MRFDLGHRFDHIQIEGEFGQGKPELAVYRHALERLEGYRIRHGEAVSVGMVFAAEVARLAGRLAPQTAARHRRVLSAVGLPTRCASAAWPALREAMAVDKKNRQARLRLVILEDLARPVIFEDPPEHLLADAFGEVTGR